MECLLLEVMVGVLNTTHRQRRERHEGWSHLEFLVRDPRDLAVSHDKTADYECVGEGCGTSTVFFRETEIGGTYAVF